MSKISIEPVGFNVLVEPDSGERVSEGGIVLPGTSRMEQDTGVLVAVGPLAWSDFEGPPWAEVGDRVMFARYGGKFVTDPETGREYKLMNDKDLNAILHSDAVMSDDRSDQ